MKLKFTLLLVSFVFTLQAQDLTISNTGEKGVCGSNWKVSGSNPVYVTVQGEATINNSVIEKYLNKGKNVVVNNLNGSIIINCKINYKKDKATPTLTFENATKGKIILTSNAAILSQTNPLNVVFETKGNIEIAEHASIISQGGLINLKAFETGISIRNKILSAITINGLLDASKLSKGGTIVIESDEINLTATAALYAKGNYGGGAILVGGDWQGGSTVTYSKELYQATKVTMDQGALIDASALLNGDGGKVVLWSNLKNPASLTQANGEIAAKGSGSSGKGGKIETSGGAVHFEGIQVSTLASDGTAGNWLVDPYNFFFNTSQLNTLASNLAGSNIEISTANGSASGNPGIVYGSGQLVFGDNFNYTSPYARQLTLSVNDNIWIKGNISSSSGGLSLVFNAPSGKAILINGDITTNGGSVTFNNSSNAYFQKTSGTQYLTTNGGALNFGAANIKLLRHNGSMEINTAGGNLTMGSGSV